MAPIRKATEAERRHYELRQKRHSLFWYLGWLLVGMVTCPIVSLFSGDLHRPIAVLDRHRRDQEEADDMIKLYRFCTAISVIAVFGCVIWHIARDVSYANNWPRSPEPELGRIIPHGAAHRTTVYISRQDDHRDLMIQITLLFASISGFAFSGLSGDLKGEVVPDKKE
jgi:hypothetical protein